MNRREDLDVALTFDLCVPKVARADVARLDRRCFPDDDPLPWAAYTSGRWVLARDASGCLIGYLYASRRTHGVLYVARVGVAPEKHNRGVASAMLQDLVDRTRSTTKAYVSDTELASTGMQRVFCRHGFLPFSPRCRWALPTSLYWRLET